MSYFLTFSLFFRCMTLSKKHLQHDNPADSNISWLHFFVCSDFLIFFLHFSLFMLIILYISALSFSSPSLSLFCHTVTLIFRHTHTHRRTPPLSHAAILHNSNSAFIPLPLFSPWSLSSLSHFLSPSCTLFLFSYPSSPSLPFSMNPPFSPYLPLSVFLFYPPFALFHLPVQMAVFSLRACPSFCLQS